MMKSKLFVEDLFNLLNMKTVYCNKPGFNLGYINKNGVKQFDCWNLHKALINGYNIDINVVGYTTPSLKVTGDVTGEQLLSTCTQRSKNFSEIKYYPAGTYLYMKNHAGTYVGEFERDGHTYNVIECTASWEKKVLASWVDPDGTRRHYKGCKAKNGAWEEFGLLSKYLEYPNDDEVPESVYAPTEEDVPQTIYKPVIPNYFLRKGNRGSEVTKLQVCLNYLKYTDDDNMSLDVDGDWGPKTHQAFLKFQRSNRLVVDGIYGPKSQSALRQAIYNV